MVVVSISLREPVTCILKDRASGWPLLCVVGGLVFPQVRNKHQESVNGNFTVIKEKLAVQYEDTLVQDKRRE